jgi:hypothetical protein
VVSTRPAAARQAPCCTGENDGGAHESPGTFHRHVVADNEILDARVARDGQRALWLAVLMLSDVGELRRPR